MLIYRMTSRRREAQLGVCTPWAASFGDAVLVDATTVSTKNAPHGGRPG